MLITNSVARRRCKGDSAAIHARKSAVFDNEAAVVRGEVPCARPSERSSLGKVVIGSAARPGDQTKKSSGEPGFQVPIYSESLYNLHESASA